MDQTDTGSARARRRRLDENYAVFERLIEESRAHLLKKRYERSAVFAEIAAYHATWNHNGLFASRELEDILESLARNGIQPSTGMTAAAQAPGVRRVLHVSSMVSGLAGLQHLLRRWIEIDQGRCHSIAVSQWSSGSIPQPLKQAVEGSGGRIELVGNSTPHIVARAERIRRLAANADLVVLHLQTEDVAPFIGLNRQPGRPPMALVNHADHAFWLGASVVDWVINLRISGLRLCRERRGIEADRLLLLPTPLDPVESTLSPPEAKRRLGLPEDAVVLLSVARAPKFVAKGDTSFPLAHLEVLQRYPRCVLLAVGPTHDAEWEDVSRRTGGRIRAYGARADTALFFQAADVYLDSFPMPSVTSLLEAGSYGIPLVTRCAHSAVSAVWGADAPGIDRHIIRSQGQADYTSRLSWLVGNPAARSQLGRDTREQIRRCHVGDNWAALLEQLYARMSTRPRATAEPFPRGSRDFSELDLLTPELLSHGRTLAEMFYEYRAALSLDRFVTAHLRRHPRLLLRMLASALIAQFRQAYRA